MIETEETNKNDGRRMYIATFPENVSLEDGGMELQMLSPRDVLSPLGTLCPRDAGTVYGQHGELGTFRHIVLRADRIPIKCSPGLN